jgi:Fe-S cluster assembly scaffold protein SufB
MTGKTRDHALGQRPGWAGDLAAMLEAYRLAGGDPANLQLPQVATLVVSASEILVAHGIPGIDFLAEPLPHGVRARIRVAPGARIERPVHLCFGLIPAEGVQEIVADYDIGAGAQVSFLAHCSFPNAVKVLHSMQAQIRVGERAELTYTEEHYHGATGGAEVRPQAVVQVADGGRLLTTFSLTRGRVGVLALDYTADVGPAALAEFTTKAYGTGDDRITVRETVRLNGAGARGLTKTRVAVRDRAVSQVYTTAEGNAAGARGHMDCTEIVRGQAEARNTPVVVVRDDQAQVTHEAAIGTVNQKELETLLARGLDEDEAVDLIIRGLIR